MLNQNYFINSNPNILDNEKGLRKIQSNSYIELCHHFLILKKRTHAVAVLPTGSGKTGLMAIAPYGISQGRVLIITPQLVIKDHVLDSLDPSAPENFWLKHNIFDNHEELPIVTEFDNTTHLSELEQSNIVILNVQKLQLKNRNSLLKMVDNDFFDMIIIDEAHHSPAKTWQDTLDYFENAKVLKVTGTPFRSDRKEIEGEVVVNYRLGQAMREGIVKTLKQFILKPEKVYLTLDNDSSKTYTIEQIEAMGLKDADYINRSVAYSEECNKQIVEASIEELTERKAQSTVPHKIIAVCCSIKHSEQVKSLYEQAGLEADVIHSKLSKAQKAEVLRKIESHQIEVIIHVAMLGEGYDHPYLSIAAIFRPYRSLAPYSQFIGRILRKVPDEQYQVPIDNIGSVIAHRDLGLDPLWREYQKEQEYTKVVELVRKSEHKEKDIEKTTGKPKANQIGNVSVEGEVLTDEEFYEYTQAAYSYEEYEEEIQQKADQLKTVFPEKTMQDLKELARNQHKPVAFNPLLKNPKKYRQTLRTEFDSQVRFDIPTEILVEFNLNKDDNTLARLPINKQFSWVVKNADNAGIIAKYLNAYLSERFGSRNKWTLKDYLNAEEYLEQIVVHLKSLIKSLTKG